MPHFRDVLYGNYSASFGAVKTYDPGLARRMYEVSYRLPELPKDAPIADIGCGKGEWLGWLQASGFTTLQGFDISAGELAFSKAIPVECGDVVETLARPQWKARFALIHAKDLLEHLTKQETVDFLLASHAALREGGALWLSTYNAQGIFASATRYGDFTHESGFTPSSMAQVLRATGFTIDRIAGLHACPQTKNGFARKWIWRAAAAPARILLRARHGGHGEAGIDTFTVDPDLFAVARKGSEKM